jgi:chemotaxis protein MotA
LADLAFSCNSLRLATGVLLQRPEATLATSQVVLDRRQAINPSALTAARPRLDGLFLAGLLIAVGATLIGISSTGVAFSYFLQPTGAIIVLGGTLGITLVTTPRNALLHSARRCLDLLAASDADPEALIEQITECARVRRRGVAALELYLPKIEERFLRKGLQLGLELTDRAEVRMILETELRMAERQGETDAKTLEVAGGFAPTIGIIGTVIGLIDVLRNFSNLQTVGHSIGTAFVSTIYGLVLANLVLLPAAHRIRARVAESFEIQEMILEGVLAIGETLHPSLVRMRLEPFVRRSRNEESQDA